MHAPASVLKPLDAVYHSAIRFITGDRFSTHHCILYQKVNWLPLKSRREMHFALFVYKALLHKLPSYINSLLAVRRSGYQTRTQGWLLLQIPKISSELGRSAFSFYAPHTWNELQCTFKLDDLMPLRHFRRLLNDHFITDCVCFL